MGHLMEPARERQGQANPGREVQSSNPPEAVHTPRACVTEVEMDRTQKREFVAGLAQVFAETSMVVVTRNQGLTVAEATDLRRRMRAAGATFKVAKNRLATRALDGTRFEVAQAPAQGTDRSRLGE